MNYSKVTTPDKSADLPVAADVNHHIDYSGFRQDLLAWYDRHKRELPWREVAADPLIDAQDKAYSTWLSEIMLQQTVVKAVMSYYQHFIERWPSVHDLANADEDDVMAAWAGLGYYSRARNLHKCAKYISKEKGGVFPDNETALIELSGIGPYTAAAITSIAFNKPAVVIDGNVDRIMVRLYALNQPIRDIKKKIRALSSDFFISDAVCNDQRCSDFAQSLMDLGATICIPKAPRCMLCPVRSYCKAQSMGIAPSLPQPAPKKKKPHRQGVVYVIRDKAGHILVEKRPDKGLLASTYGMPTSEWGVVEDDTLAIDSRHDDDALAWLEGHCIAYDKTENAHIITHVFTHFSLSLRIKEIRVPDFPSVKGTYKIMSPSQFEELGLPSLFDKVRKFILK